VAIGLAVMILPKLGLRVPGDIMVRRKNWTLYMPLGTSILLSIVLTLLLNWLGRR